MIISDLELKNQLQVRLNMNEKDLFAAVRSRQIPFIFPPSGLGLRRSGAGELKVISFKQYKAELLAAIAQAEAEKNCADLIKLASPKACEFLTDKAGQYRPAPLSLYLLFDGQDLVYIGQTSNVSERKKQHKAKGKRFDAMLIVAVPNTLDAVQLEGRLIAAIKTKYNRCNIAQNNHKLIN